MNSSHQNCATPSTHLSSAAEEDFVSEKKKNSMTGVIQSICRREEKAGELATGSLPTPTEKDGPMGIYAFNSSCTYAGFSGSRRRIFPVAS